MTILRHDGPARARRGRVRDKRAELGASLVAPNWPAWATVSSVLSLPLAGRKAG